MKIFRKSVITLGILAALVVPVGVQTAYAALTILPGTDKAHETVEQCKPLLDEFELTGKMPTEDEEKENADQASSSDQDKQAVEDAKKASDESQKAFDEAKSAADEAAAAEKAAQDEVNSLKESCKDVTDPVDVMECDEKKVEAGKKLDEAGQKNLEANMKLSVAKDENEAAQQSLASAQSSSENSSAAATLVGMRENLLGCAIKTGRVTLAMIPYFITYITNFLLAIVGLICVLFIVIGGYSYIYGGLTEQKEKGKKTIYNALLGLSVSVLAWVIVNIIMAAVTS